MVLLEKSFLGLNSKWSCIDIHVTNAYYTGRMTIEGEKNGHPYWADPQVTYGIWNDGGTSTAEDWVFGPMSQDRSEIGKDSGHFYSNRGTAYPSDVIQWYTSSGGSTNRGTNSVICGQGKTTLSSELYNITRVLHVKIV